MRILTKTQEKFYKYQTEITELKNIAKLKNSVEGFNSRLDQVKERISKIEHSAVEVILSGKSKERIKKCK